MSKGYNPLSRANPHIRRLHAYVPGQQPSGGDWVKLNTNENPYPPSPKVLEAIRGELDGEGTRLRLYPNPLSIPLRQALAAHHGLKPDQVLAGNGADDVLNLLMRAFAGPERAAGMTVPSYSLYEVLAEVQQAKMIEVAFDRSMKLDPKAIGDCGANIFFLTSPNAPTGVGFTRKEVEAAASAFEGILVIDETYAPFAGEDAVALLARHPNVVIVRSFSKAFSLAGLRVGYALASAEIIEVLDRVRESYNLDRLAQAGALAALGDGAYYRQVTADILTVRSQMAEWYAFKGWFCYASATNFHFVEPRNSAGQSGPQVAESLYNALCARRVLVRYFPKHPLTQSFLRVTLGTEKEMQRYRDAVDSWLKIN
ncbi:histidinol-phosphate transaminase [Ruficoccus amylovorans]|uniref:Histidinol-phosphate aminotransferase n=1 Tax=Ruficoccus amylovorans TaxID=1804625 RepID=A0A842H9X0_9BACT|nr:histidinol-phosphate transaminase [Ruficoccus amylovorans]MBC2593293.1 histidinol-phosphate transaminase [Ruficoccus amylovorans]